MNGRKNRWIYVNQYTTTFSKWDNKYNLIAAEQENKTIHCLNFPKDPFCHSSNDDHS